RPAELGLVLDVHDAFAAERDDRGDAHRLAELDVAGGVDREAVHDADAEALRVERDLAADGELADVPLGGAGALAALPPGALDVLGGDDGALRRRGRAE